MHYNWRQVAKLTHGPVVGHEASPWGMQSSFFHMEETSVFKQRWFLLVLVQSSTFLVRILAKNSKLQTPFYTWLLCQVYGQSWPCHWMSRSKIISLDILQHTFVSVESVLDLWELYSLHLTGFTLTYHLRAMHRFKMPVASFSGQATH